MSETPQVDIVIPVKNEEHDLAPGVTRLAGYLRDSFPFTARVTIADNGSTDGTWAGACALEVKFADVRAVHLELPGRGRALHQIWSSSDAEVLAYMDVDLSTDLNALLPLVAPLLSGHSDVAIGTRLARSARVSRGPKREVISRCYNLLLHGILGVGFSDAQCGFKAIRAEQARELLPLVEDKGWFFDTELLVLAERAGLRIHEVPVDWIDDPDSRVDIVSTARGDLRGIARVGAGLARGTIKVPQLRQGTLGQQRGMAFQVPRFAVIGVASTLAYVVLFLAFRTFMGTQAANALSLLLTAIGNTAANRRLTFGVRGRQFSQSLLWGHAMSAATTVFRPARRPETPGRVSRLWRGPDTDPRWARPALLGLLVATALLYLWDLSGNGYANDFYAAAVEAGTKSWKAFFFGSFDSSNFITVDKTPASLWIDELSARVFGFSTWSLLVPQAIEGVASVLLLFAAVRRWFGPGAGLIAGAVLALTPAAVLIFRFNNPDALLVLLMTAAGYCVQRALERDRTRWLVFAGLLLGFAFLTKMMQAFLVLPGFGVAYLWAGPARLGRRLWQLLAGLGGVIVGAGWWIVIAELTPAADRPYFGGSTNNNILQLALGYNGLGRLDGSETGSIGGGGGGSAFGGSTGIFRLFGAEFGGQVAWLIPAALLSLGALLWVSRRAARTSRVRAFALLWGGWLLVTGLVFSFMQGIIHPYYMVALAPAIGALVGVGAISFWQSGLVSLPGRICTAVGVLGSGIWAYVLLDRTADWLPWLRWTVLLAGVLGAISLFAVPLLIAAGRRAPALAFLPLGFALIAGLGGPLAYGLDTARTTHTGSIPSAGPAVTGGFGGGGAPGGFGGGVHIGAGRRTFPGGTGGTGRFPGGGTAGTGGTGTGTGPTRVGFGGGAGAGGGGGLSGSTQVSSTLIKLLEQDASSYKWIAATEGTQSGAPIELATGGDAVLAIGGFNGTDPSPTLAQFEALVAKHEIHYYVGTSNNSFGGGNGSSSIASWVAAHFKSETVGGVIVYNLTEAK